MSKGALARPTGIRPVLVTGARGFVGRHLLAELGGDSEPVDVDVRDGSALANALAEARPRAVVHLAAAASAAASWDAVQQFWAVNALGTVNLLDAVRMEVPSARVIAVSSAEVYGSADVLPTPEDAPVAPLSPYGASKAAAEIACERARRADGLDVVIVRPFNHVGPGQTDAFAVGSWTQQIAQLEADGGGTLRVGDLSVERDLTDVRDVARAYRLLLDPNVSAGTYNVASGTSLRLERVVDLLLSMARVKIDVEHDPDRRRQADVQRVEGDHSRLTAATGWRPQIPLERTLADALDYARSALTERRTATR